ncbi:unnamed protein product [Lymnaea stagnalis]|uniref:Uncharacterized protein n=1 Tax=Lymnaea stagnalis TaxID=6523 RepID=A0AAV2I244_LYMST
MRDQRCRLKVERSRKPAISLHSFSNKWPMFPPRRALQQHTENSRTGEAFAQRQEKAPPSPVAQSQMPERQIFNLAERTESPRKLSDQWIGQNVNRNHKAEQKPVVSGPHPPLSDPCPNLSYPRPHARESAALRTNFPPAKRKPNPRGLLWSAIGNEVSDAFPFISESRHRTSDPVTHIEEPRTHRSDPRLHTSATCALASPRHHLTKPRPQKSEPRLQGPSTWSQRFPGDRHPQTDNAYLHLRPPGLSDTASRSPDHALTLTNPWVKVHEPHPPLPIQLHPAKEQKQCHQNTWKVQGSRKSERQDAAYKIQTKGIESWDPSFMEESTSLERVLSWLDTIPVTPSYPCLNQHNVTPSNSLEQVPRSCLRKKNAAHRGSHFTVVKGVTARLNRREAAAVVQMSSPKKRELVIKPVSAYFEETEDIDFCPCAPQPSPCSSVYRDLNKEQNMPKGQTTPPQNKTEHSTSKTKSFRSSKKRAPTPMPIMSLQIAPQPSINVKFKRKQKPLLKTSTPHRRDKTLLRKASRQFIMATTKLSNELMSVRSTSTPLVRRVKRTRRRRGRKKKSKKCKSQLKFLDKAIRMLKCNMTLLSRRPGHVELRGPDSRDFRPGGRFAAEVSGSGIHHTTSTKYATVGSLRSNSENGLYRPLTEQCNAGGWQREE